MAATYSLDIQKQMGGEYFTNRYMLDIASAAGGYDAAAAIYAAERAIMLEAVAFISYRISSVVVGDDDYIIVPLGTNGQRTVGAAAALPLFNVVRVDFAVTTGRPSRKYLRGILVEGDQSDFGVINSTLLGFVDTNYTAYLVALSEYVDVDGQAIISGRAISNVGMRQLRRGSRRRTEPIIPVS